MTTKVGSITSLGRTGAKFVEAYLSSGDRVELAHPLWDRIRNTYSPGQELVFVERRGRLFTFVHWAGTAEEAGRGVAQGNLKAEELPPQPIALAEVDEFFAQLASMSPAQWTEAVMEFIRLQMSDEAGHQAAWRSVLGITQESVDGEDELLTSAVRSVTKLAQASVQAAFPDVDEPSPRYEAARRAAGDMVIAAAFAVLLRRQLPDEASKLLYAPFRPLFSDGPTPA